MRSFASHPSTRAAQDDGANAIATRALFVVFAAVFASQALAQQPRIASDFEIQQMERQAASATDFLSQLAAHLNLGDLRLTRNESAAARAEYQKALDVAARERTGSRKAGDLSRYATATMYEGLAAAKLGRDELAFQWLDEAARYSADRAGTWNLYASAMQVLGLPRKAVSASRNAVAIAAAQTATSPSPANELDLAIYRYSLALALSETGQSGEAIDTLRTVVASLRSSRFDALRKDVARRESFEIYSTARGDAPAYISLLNRSQLELASLLEKRGDTAAARKVYDDVLAARSDDATALTAIARLARSDEERARTFAEAFDANPFSIDLIRDYQRWLGSAKPQQPDDGATTGAQVRRALDEMNRRENRAARTTLDELLTKFPGNDVLQFLAGLNDVALDDVAAARSRRIGNAGLRAELDRRIAASAAAPPPFLTAPAAAVVTPSASDLRQTIALFEQDRITPAQRLRLDATTFSSLATFDGAQTAAAPGQTVFETGTIEGVPFRFSEPTAFSGAFAAAAPVRLTYRILGGTDVNGSDALLLEPVKLEVPR